VERDGNGDFHTHSVGLDGNLTFGQESDFSANSSVITNASGLVLGDDYFANLFVGTTGNPVIGGGAQENIGIGAGALSHEATGSANTAVGAKALKLTTDSYSTAVGEAALHSSTTGLNDAFGIESLGTLTTGTNNVAFGGGALVSLETGSKNVAIGAAAGSNYTGAESANILIGNVGTEGESNVIRIGDPSTQTAAYLAGAYGVTLTSPLAMGIDSNGHLGTLPASSLTGVSTDTGSTIVGRDNSGNFASNSITLDSSLVFSDPNGTSGVINNSLGLMLTADLSNNVLVGVGGNPENILFDTANNVGVGFSALSTLEVGTASTAVGAYALGNAPFTNANTAVGMNTLYNVQWGPNDAFGVNALQALTSGTGNSALGYQSLMSLLTGSNNLAVGQGSGVAYTGGESNNIDIGNSGVQGESGVIHIGTAGNHTAVYIAGIYGTFVAAGSPVVVNSNGQLGIGTASGMSWQGSYGSASTPYADNAVVETSNGGVYVCTNASGCTGQDVTNAGYWTPIQPPLDTANTANTLVARDASGNFGGGTVTLDGNLAFSKSSTLDGTAGVITGPEGLVLASYDNQNVFVGTGSNPALNTATYSSTAVGYQALFSNTARENTAVGAYALAADVTGPLNVAVGNQALSNNTGGGYNVAVGESAMQNGTSGSGNTAIGAGSLAICAADGNTALGNSTLANLPDGAGNIALGASAGLNYTGSESSNILIGNQGTAGESDVIRIGDPSTQTATYVAGIAGASVSGVPVMVSSSGQLGVMTSSRRFKKDIHDMGDQSDVLMSLRPVSFRYKPEYDAEGGQQYGLIAEEVEKIAPQLVAYDDQGRPWTVRYNLVNAMLLNELQKQRREAAAQRSAVSDDLAQAHATIDRQAATIASLQQELSDVRAELDSRMARLEAAMAERGAKR
jgi:hypothetical protein